MPSPTTAGEGTSVLNMQFILIVGACWAVPVVIIMLFMCVSMPMRGPDANVRVRMRKREQQSQQPSDGRRHVTLSPVKPD
jgi:hypothetical protein